MEKSKFLETIGEQIYLARKQKHVSQKKMAQDLQISNYYICRVERGKTNLTSFTLYKICYYLGLSFTLDNDPQHLKEYTCFLCEDCKICAYAFDEYNKKGDCLAIK